MKTVIGTTVFITKFAYPVIDKIIVRDGVEIPITQRESVCYIKYSKSQMESEIIVQDSVRLDSREQFDRSIGRRKAFKKALTKLFADKALRERFSLTNVEFAQFIGDYYEQCPKSISIK